MRQGHGLAHGFRKSVRSVGSDFFHAMLKPMTKSIPIASVPINDHESRWNWPKTFTESDCSEIAARTSARNFASNGFEEQRRGKGLSVRVKCIFLNYKYDYNEKVCSALPDYFYSHIKSQIKN
jgi:hypothetical protein